MCARASLYFDPFVLPAGFLEKVVLQHVAFVTPGDITLLSQPAMWFSTAELSEGVLGLGSNYANYFTYSGSLSEPPCTEGVTWIMMKTPVTISADDYAVLASLQGATARPTQALNGRAVYETATGEPGL